jgi:hypothetical protein
MVGSWDTTVALAFAAEELVFAAQALTTDLVPREHGLGVAHRHLHELLQHQRYLPSEIGSRLRNLDALYAEWENSPATGATRRPSVTLATMAVLSDVRDLLHVQQLSLYRQSAYPE